ncbi:MAG: hypothetical protein V8Q57_07655 [Blautia sp.]
MFGDGAGAVVLKTEESAQYIQISHSIGENGAALTCASRNQQKFVTQTRICQKPICKWMEKKLFKFAVSKVPKESKRYFKKLGKIKTIFGIICFIRQI